LTTTWTPPASCTTRLPVLLGGSCSSPYCWSYSPSDLVESWYAMTNWGYWTTSFQQASSDCYPPSSSNFWDFTYSPAIGCPIGYTTASEESGFNYDKDVFVACCPSDYDLIDTSSSYTDTLYYCLRPVPQTGESFEVVAYGTVPQYDVSGLSTDYYGTASVITTTIFTPPPTTTLFVTARAIPMLVPSTLATVTPTSTSDVSNSIPSYSLFHLPFAYSIIATVGIGVGSLILLCCCWSMCLRSRRRPRVRPSISVSHQRYVPQYTSGNPYVPAVPEPVTMRANPNRSSSLPDLPTCQHKSESSCSNLNQCCRCKDVRKNFMKLEDRLKTGYCWRCQQHWRGKRQPSEFPPEWKLANCAHIFLSNCSKLFNCCACEDKRRQKLSLRDRLSPYCLPCKSHWKLESPEKLPAGWEIQPCQHLKQCDCIYRIDCCACDDVRTSKKLDLAARTRLYCSFCKQHWSRASPDSLPEHWGISEQIRNDAASKKAEALRKFKPFYSLKEDASKKPKVSRRPRATSLTHGQMQDLGPKNPSWQQQPQKTQRVKKEESEEIEAGYAWHQSTPALKNAQTRAKKKKVKKAAKRAWDQSAPADVDVSAPVPDDLIVFDGSDSEFRPSPSSHIFGSGVAVSARRKKLPPPVPRKSDALALVPTP
jgi:hypothetical protein